MAEMHYFDVTIAKMYGVNSAVLLQNLYHWIKKNKANGKNEFDNNFWTYNSKKAFAELFPYMNERQIDYAMKKLIDDGVVVTGNYNKFAYDRTLWYAITKKGYSILQNCEMEATNLPNGNDENVEPIPNINTVSKTTDMKHIYDAIVGYLNQKANTNFKSTTKATQEHINGRLHEGFTVEQFKIVIDKKCKQWLNNPKMVGYLRPKTLFGTNFESYLNEPDTVSRQIANGQQIQIINGKEYIFHNGNYFIPGGNNIAVDPFKYDGDDLPY